MEKEIHNPKWINCATKIILPGGLEPPASDPKSDMVDRYTTEVSGTSFVVVCIYVFSIFDMVDRHIYTVLQVYLSNRICGFI